MKTFKARYNYDVRPLLQKKGQFDYLPWPVALRLAMEADPSFTYRYIKNNGSLLSMIGDTGVVEVEATMFGKTLCENLPVMNNKKKAITNPDSKDVNDALKRCLVKVIACHGIGLAAWSREFPTLMDSTAPPTGWSWAQVAEYCKGKGWPDPATLNPDRLDSLIKYFVDKVGVGFDDLPPVSNPPSVADTVADK